MSRISKRAQNITPFIVMDILEKAHALESQGRDIIHLEVGEPDFQTPKCVCDAGGGAIEMGDTHYTHSQGTPDFREAVCRHHLNKYGVQCDPEQVVATAGTSPALFILIATLLDPGDEIIISDPHYPCYPNFAEFIGAKPVFVDVNEEDAFQLRAREIKKKIGPRTRAIIINSPSNPTGTLLTAGRMQEIADLGLPVISDEIYHGLVYGQAEHSILEFTENAFVINGFSKLYAMTGWRLGYIIAPKDFIRPLQKIQQNFFVSAGSISQRAGIAALTEAQADVEKMIKIYDERRKYMIRRVRELGFGLKTEPEGAFYMLLNAKHLAHSSYDLAFEILEKAGVGVTPGIDFGQNAEGYIRLSYANCLENIKEGLDRIGKFLEQR